MPRVNLRRPPDPNQRPAWFSDDELGRSAEQIGGASGRFPVAKLLGA